MVNISKTFGSKIYYRVKCILTRNECTGCYSFVYPVEVIKTEGYTLKKQQNHEFTQASLGLTDFNCLKKNDEIIVTILDAGYDKQDFRSQVCWNTKVEIIRH